MSVETLVRGTLEAVAWGLAVWLALHFLMTGPLSDVAGAVALMTGLSYGAGRLWAGR